jgi:hypothetical protein
MIRSIHRLQSALNFFMNGILVGPTTAVQKYQVHCTGEGGGRTDTHTYLNTSVFHMAILLGLRDPEDDDTAFH